MSKLKTWLKAIRAPFLTATIIPVLLGTAIAWHQIDVFNYQLFFLTLIGVIFLHIGTNLANDYFDHLTKNDELNKTPTPFSGGSRVIQDGLIKPRNILLVSLLFFGLGSLIGLYLNAFLPGNIILILGMIGVFCGFFYTASPLRIGYLGIGELIVGVCFGPLVVMGSYCVQATRLDWQPLWASLPVGILIGLVLAINEFPDYEADKLVNKKTFVVRWGKKKAIKVYLGLLGMVYVLVLLSVVFRLMPVWTLITFLSLPLALKAVRIGSRKFDRIYELLPANAATIGLHSGIGLLLMTGYILDKLL